MNSQEKAFFFGGRGNRRYAVLHTPDSNSQRGIGWVFCSPIGEERNFSHRTLVELARELCRQGHHVLRFDYRGHGDSDGLFEYFAADDYVEDAVAAAAELEARTGVACRAFWGLRMGAVFAAQAAAVRGTNPLLVLCDPVVRGSQYLDEQLRSVLAAHLLVAQGPNSRSEIRRKLENGEMVFVQGRPFTNHIWQSFYAIDLTAIDCPTQNRILITEASVREEKAPTDDYQALAQSWGECTDVTVKVVNAPSLHAGQINRSYGERVRPKMLFQETLKWIADATRHFDAASAAPQRQEIPVIDSSAESGEQPVEFFSDNGRIAGILHLPQKIRRDTAVVIAPHAVSRTGYNRLYVKIARRLAENGWVVLRFDGYGLGDSDGSLDFTTGSNLFLSVESGMQLADTVAAMDYLEEKLQINRFVITGACGGAVTSAYAAANDDRVVAIAPLEMSLHFYAPIETAEAPPLWLYRHKLISLTAWRRVFTLQVDLRTHIRWGAQVVRRLLLRKKGSSKDHSELESKIGTRVNYKLVDALRNCCSRNVPVLCVFGTTENAEYYQRCHEVMFHQADMQVTGHVIAGADHNFSLPQHTQELIDIISGWLEDSAGFQHEQEGVHCQQTN